MTCDWRSFPADCDVCGGDVEIWTELSLEDGECYGNDPVRCKKCRANGAIYVEEDGCIIINWEEGIA